MTRYEFYMLVIVLAAFPATRPLAIMLVEDASAYAQLPK